MQQEPIFVLKPNLGVAIIPTILFGLIIGIFLAFQVTPLIFIAAGTWTGIATALGIIAITIGLLLFFKMMNLRARRYLFFQHKAEFYEGFLNIIQRTVSYQKVTDCVLTKSVWDRLFGTGTIRLVTAGHEGRVGGGIIIQYVDNPNEVYREVQKLLGMHQ